LESGGTKKNSHTRKKKRPSTSVHQRGSWFHKTKKGDVSPQETEREKKRQSWGGNRQKQKKKTPERAVQKPQHRGTAMKRGKRKAQRYGGWPPGAGQNAVIWGGGR